MIGGFSNIIWTGLLFLIFVIYLEITGGRSDLGLMATLIFIILSAFALRSSASYDKDKNNWKSTLVITILFFLNSLAFTPFLARSFNEVILFSLILLGPGTILLIPASILQIQSSKK